VEQSDNSAADDRYVRGGLSRSAAAGRVRQSQSQRGTHAGQPADVSTGGANQRASRRGNGQRTRATNPIVSVDQRLDPGGRSSSERAGGRRWRQTTDLHTVRRR
jgi:hypothetical protein